MPEKLTACVPYEESLYEDLQNPSFVVEYLNAALEDGEPEVFLLALRQVVQAQGGFSELARKTGLNREQLYRTLSRGGNPRLHNLDSILDSLGLHLSVQSAVSR
jgi:probable addiction module antidote protein